MDILITGASGLIGSGLQRHFISQGHTVKPLLRGSQSQDTHQPWWDIQKGMVDLKGFEPEVVIHLAGENIAAGRWTNKQKARILDSRLKGTQLLVEHLVNMDNKPKALLSSSAIGFYGLRGDEILDEDSAAGNNEFVTQVCLSWEAETRLADASGIRVVNMRTGVVLDEQDGALAKMLPAFKLGLGGVLGSGKQYLSWVSLDDMVNMVDFLMHSKLRGAVNMTSPNPSTNKAFTKALGAALKRPTVLPMPAFMARLLFGEMAEELLLGGARVMPKKLLEAGYDFKHNTIDDALTAILRS